jgi:hypothetical protein
MQEPQPPLGFKASDRAPPMVCQILESKGYVEVEEDCDEHWNVHWKAGRFKPSEYAAANRSQRLNHFPKTTGITKKDCLLRNLRRMRGIHGAICNFFPESYILPTEYMTLVKKAEANPRDKPIWILKPADSSQGRKIFLIRDISEISYGHFSESMTAEMLASAGGEPRVERENPKLDEKGRAIQTELDMTTTLKMLKSRLNRTTTPCVKFTEMHIAQRYIERPLCVCGYKLDLRLYVLLISAEPLRVYWYNDCLVRFATQRYDLSDLENTCAPRRSNLAAAQGAPRTAHRARTACRYSHLTNSSINKNSTSYSVDKEGIRAGCKWSLQSFTREHPESPLTSPLLWARIKARRAPVLGERAQRVPSAWREARTTPLHPLASQAIVTMTLLSIAHAIPDNGGCFELLGYDVIIDEGLKPWLLEVNASPALAIECSADKQAPRSIPS